MIVILRFERMTHSENDKMDGIMYLSLFSGNKHNSCLLIHGLHAQLNKIGLTNRKATSETGHSHSTKT